MNIEKYDIKILSDFDYQFFSKGKNGIVEKKVVFCPTEIPNYFRLSFGDVVNNYIEEMSISNNGDVDLIIATVVWSVICFTRQNTKRHVKFTGATESRTRLFAMWINKNRDELFKYLNIYGYCNGKCEKFIPNKRYNSFLISLNL